jgi:multiple sugar transport system permease protein
MAIGAAPSPAGRSGLSINRILLQVALLCGALVMVMPFAWMLSTSLKTNAEALSVPPRWIPGSLVWQN